MAESPNELLGSTFDASLLIGVFDSLESGMCVIELLYEGERAVDYRFLATNKSFERHSGLVDVQGKRAHEMITDFEDHWFVAYEQVARTGEPVRVVNEAKGLGRWFEVSASRIGGAGSRILVILFKDITSERDAELLLKDARARLEATMAAGEVATWIWDIQKNTVVADRNLARIFGVSDADAAGGPIEAYVARMHPEDRERVQALIDAALRGDGRFEAEYRILRGDDARWVMARGTVERDAEGRPLRLPGVVLDLTMQKATERALQRSETRLQLALVAGHMGAWDIDLTTGVMQCSAACKTNYGRSPDEPFTYEDLRATVFEDDRAHWRSTVEAAIARAESFEIEYRVTWPDGSLHWVYVRGNTSTAPGTSTTVGLSGVSLLVDEKKQIEDSLRAADRQKDEFLAMASHELRTPLNAILGWSRLLRSGQLDPSAYARGLEVIERNATSQVQLIEDILDGSRILSGKLHLEVRALDLGTLVSGAVETVRPAALAKQIELTVAIDPDAAHITGDPDRLQQVVWNLANNAIKFTPKGGHVEVKLAREATTIALVVTDSGQGIPASFLPHVFERFRQVEGSTTRRHGGLGLGLTLVKHLVEAHGGTVRAASDGEGRGARFTVTLPVRAVRGEAPASEQPRSLRTSGAPNAAEALVGVTVLVVDDEADARELVGTVLRACGADVILAGSAEKALDALATTWPTVMVSDIGMPSVDGYELMRRVRTDFGSRGAALPAVAVTAYAREEDRRLALTAGFHAHLAKPVEPTDLVKVVGRVVHAATVPATPG